MRDRYYQCQICDEVGTVGLAFVQVFKKGGSSVTHNCTDKGSKTKWMKNYIPENKRVQEVKDLHGVFIGSVVTVKGLEKEGELKVIGIKPTSKKVWIEVWNVDTKNSWVSPVEYVKVIR